MASRMLFLRCAMVRGRSTKPGKCGKSNYGQERVCEVEFQTERESERPLEKRLSTAKARCSLNQSMMAADWREKQTWELPPPDAPSLAPLPAQLTARDFF
ncbi:unnamed protein product [Danaus chrysippus]|uniref:(African queen) hypothetical protein n=1 Tax=Danaus chrysippus TaxID=151541 RepID=A0A8J2Q7Q4_9NEOP|nr:unnamed protein product [Danaus chrysippus]CAG9561765.1 unnamed protein product [Danaus chrysippus]